MCSHCGCSINHGSTKPSLDPSIQSFDEEGDITCTQSDCDAETSSCKKQETVSDGVVENDERADPQQSNADEFVINKALQCVVSPCTSKLNIKSVNKEPSCSASLNNTEGNVASIEASPLQVECASPCNSDFVDGLNNMAIVESQTESVCQQTQTLNNQDIIDTCTSLCSGLAEKEKTIDSKACELITTHCEVTENDFHSKQGCLDVTVNHTAPNKMPESSNLHVEVSGSF